MVQEPDIILADEPIASLDPRNTRIVMDALLRINKHFGITVLCNLHSLDLARSYCDRLIGMAAGRVVFDGAPSALTEHIARELYDLEANEVMGRRPRIWPADAAVPARLGAADRCLMVRVRSSNESRQTSTRRVHHDQSQTGSCGRLRRWRSPPPPSPRTGRRNIPRSPSR